MDFPSAPAEPTDEIAGLADALGAEVVALGRSFDLLVELASPDIVATLQPDMTALAAIDTRAVLVTAAGDIDGGQADFVSRVFAPRVGIPEDPVTGSAHCISGPWWSERLGKTELAAHQVSARGGRLTVRIVDDRVELTGQAVTVSKGASSDAERIAPATASQPGQPCVVTPRRARHGEPRTTRPGPPSVDPAGPCR